MLRFIYFQLIALLSPILHADFTTIAASSGALRHAARLAAYGLSRYSVPATSARLWGRFMPMTTIDTACRALEDDISMRADGLLYAMPPLYYAYEDTLLLDAFRQARSQVSTRYRAAANFLLRLIFIYQRS